MEALGWAASLVIASAAVASGAQLLGHAYLRYVADRFVWMSRDALWMTPLATSVIITCAAAIAAVAMRLVRPALIRPVVGATCLSLAAFSALLPLRNIHPLALFWVALGLGVRSYFAFRDAPARMAVQTRRAAALCSALLLAIIMTEWVARARSANPRGPVATAPAQQSPNIIVLILDTVRAASMSLYGWEIPTTPQLAQLAGESTVYQNAIAPSAWSLPSHASMFTGVRSGLLNTDPKHPVRLTTPTLAEALRDRGYSTGAFTANLFYTTYESGMMQGFDIVDDYRVTPTEIVLHANLMQLPFVRMMIRARSLGDVARAFKAATATMPREPVHVQRNAANVLAAFQKWRSGVSGRPYMAFINLFDAHGEMPAPPTHNPALAGRRGAEGDYERRISYIDAEIGRVLADLRSAGALDNTMLIISSDHGEQFGEHRLIGHGNSLYMPLLRIPLLVRLPGAFPAGQRLDGPLSLTDLPATVASVVGLAPGAFPGNPWPRSPVPDSARPAALAEVGRMIEWDGPAEKGALAAIVTQNHLLIERSDGVRELFDLRRDPAEQTNLAMTEVGVQLTRTLREQMHSVKTGRHETTSSPK